MTRSAKQAPLPFLLLVVLLLGGCVRAESWEAARLPEDIEAAGAPTALKQQTPEPARSTERYSIDGRAHVADFYHPRQGHGGDLLLVPGFPPAGKNAQRVVAPARPPARHPFRVAGPDCHGYV